LLIHGGRVIDPAQGRDALLNVFVRDGRVEALTPERPAADRSLAADGCLVVPGLIDMHVHLREPGAPHKETVASGTAAAVAGGFTAVGCMPNTRPTLDSPEVVHQVMDLAAASGLCRVHPIAALSLGRDGRTLSDYEVLLEAGAVAFSDDGDGLDDDALMAESFRRLAKLDRIAIQHCEARDFPRGVMHLGTVSEALGLPGFDPLSEELMIARDIALAEACQARYHVAHVSTALAVEMVRRAQSCGVQVTTEVCPHHLLLTDDACRDGDAGFKMHPPLRPQHDVEACIAGVVDGTIDMLVTDHAPHAPDEKALGFMDAPAGIIGLETSIALFAEALVHPGHIGWPRLIELMSTIPARRFAIPGGDLSPGRVADITLIDPDLEWTIQPEQFQSKSRNCPFSGRRVRGKAVHTIVEGQVCFDGHGVFRQVRSAG
jgi:dihydroorotase